ncbi:RTA1 like protein-domain-containing protein [Coprinopsis sp. MPI-PUGE-AT-0042]|nr:RTA1 like protein-domain-containing protein [Coprinopsis sp. MPI-PUGE-AT-0042]
MADQNSSDRYVFYYYEVSVPAAATFIALFFLTTVYHSYQLAKTRRWNMVPFIIGGIMSVGGYAARIASHYDTWDLGAYITQSFLLLVAPVFFAATIYMTLAGIIISSTAENVAKVRSFEQTPQLLRRSSSTGYTALREEDHVAPYITASDVEAALHSTVLKIPVIWVTRIFVTADVIALFTQGGGGGLLAKGNSVGEKIVLGGLLFQIAAFSFFLVVAIAFDMEQRRRFRSSRAGASAKRGWRNVAGWRKMLYILYAASVLLLVRNTFRVIEYAQGHDGYLLRNEFWLYIFDAALMFVLMVMLNVVHPGEVLIGDVYQLERQAEKATKGRRRGGDEIEMGHGRG